MSGGHWDYMGRQLEERAVSAGEVWKLMAVLEHELDWGLSADTCAQCARNRMAPALEAFFDSRCEDASTAMAIARDGYQNLCVKCSGITQ